MIQFLLIIGIRGFRCVDGINTDKNHGNHLDNSIIETFVTEFPGKSTADGHDQAENDSSGIDRGREFDIIENGNQKNHGNDQYINISILCSQYHNRVGDGKTNSHGMLNHRSLSVAQEEELSQHNGNQSQNNNQQGICKTPFAPQETCEIKNGNNDCLDGVTGQSSLIISLDIT